MVEKFWAKILRSGPVTPILKTLPGTGSITGKMQTTWSFLVTEGYSSDHGVFGKYEFSVFNWNAQSVKLLHSETYGHIAGKAEGDTLGFELVNNDHGIDARLVRRQLAFTKDKTGTGYRGIRTVTKADTTVISLTNKTEMKTNRAVDLPEFGTRN